MGALVGHVAPGFGFFVIGLWHLFNHIRLHARGPSSYSSPPWFPSPRVRYLELYMIMFGCSMSIAMELFIGPDRHQPLDPDGTIPSNHLHNFEHSLISLSFFTYAAFAIVLDRVLIPKGCFMNLEEGHLVVRCHSDEALHRAKSLVNIGFSWFLIGVTIFSVSLYLILTKIYGDSVEYQSLDLEADDVESQKRAKTVNDEPSRSFIHVDKLSSCPNGSDMER
ncbi:hypothetical protein CRG98_036461 [Punica granatum]|uniref:Uncharacterized protein n=1 Tax=Punica granatum TaxID=22663 RepID=A0A2I0IGL1_PUNGR|nr:hypothetical protein CRG98_036461 [Punica granatum]